MTALGAEPAERRSLNEPPLHSSEQRLPLNTHQSQWGPWFEQIGTLERLPFSDIF